MGILHRESIIIPLNPVYFIFGQFPKAHFFFFAWKTGCALIRM